MGNFAYHLRREGESLRARSGAAVILVHVAIVGVFGVLFPWMRPTVFLNPTVLSAYACLGLLFAGPAAAQAFGMERPQSLTEAVARVLLATGYGEVIAVLLLFAAFATVYATNRYAFAPDLGTLLAAGFLGLTASFAIAALAGWITLFVSAAAARRALRIVFLLLLVLFFFRSESLPDVAGELALVSLLIAGAALFGISRALLRP